MSTAQVLLRTQPFLPFQTSDPFPRLYRNDYDEDGVVAVAGQDEDDDDDDEGDEARKKLSGILFCFCGLSSRSVITLMIPSCPFPHVPSASL